MLRLRRPLLALALCGGLASTTLAARSGDHLDPAPAVVAAALAQVGDGYAFGAAGPDTWDCSGLVFALWRAAGVADVPRVSREQAAWATAIPREQEIGRASCRERVYVLV